MARKKHHEPAVTVGPTPEPCAYVSERESARPVSREPLPRRAESRWSFFDILNAARKARIPSDCKLVLLILVASVRGRDDRIWISINQLAKETGFHHDCVAIHLNDLHFNGVLAEGLADLPRRGGQIDETAQINFRFHDDCILSLGRTGAHLHQQPTNSPSRQYAEGLGEGL